MLTPPCMGGNLPTRQILTGAPPAIPARSGLQGVRRTAHRRRASADRPNHEVRRAYRRSPERPRISAGGERLAVCRPPAASHASPAEPAGARFRKSAERRRRSAAAPPPERGESDTGARAEQSHMARRLPPLLWGRVGVG